MKRIVVSLSQAGLVCLLLVWSVPGATGTDSSAIRVALQKTGADPDASGSLLATLNPKRSSLSFKAANLTPGGSYTLEVGGQTAASFMADAKGRARLTFTNPARRNSLALDFEPRGSMVSVQQGSNSVLRAMVSGPGEPDGSSVVERADLSQVSSGSRGKASAQYQLSRNGKRTFAITCANISGTNLVFVDGIKRGEIKARGRTGRVKFDSDPRKASDLLLDFEPRGHVVDIVQVTNVMFSGPMRAKAKDVSYASPGVGRATIPSTGADPDGTAQARYRVYADATRTFCVELDHMSAGVYEFLADDIVQGSINVSAEGSEGEIEFSTRSDDAHELPLSFDPESVVFVIRQGTVVFFQGQLTSNLPGPGTNDVPGVVQESLTSTGLAPGANGDAKFEIDERGRHKFSVEIEEVPAGTYQLWVDQTQRGRIAAQLTQNQVKGQIEFSSDRSDSGELPLNFEPRGALIEVKSAAGVFFSHVFGVGASNGVSAPLRIELPLFSTGLASNGTAQAKFKRDDRSRRAFEVELEHAPAGDYTLLVGGASRGVISVSTIEGDTWGKIRYEDQPQPGELQLDFDPLGQEIAVEREGVSYFQRSFPAGQ